MFNVPSFLKFSTNIIYSRGNLIRNFRKLHLSSNFNQLRRPGFQFKNSGGRQSLFPGRALIGSVVTVALCECCKKDKCGCGEANKSPPVCSQKCPNCQGCKGKRPIGWEKEDLTHSFLLRQANVVTVDSITRILSETMSAIEDYHCKYRRLIEMLMELMEESRCATDTRQELIDCKQIVVRSSIEDMKKSIIELECYLDSVSRLAHASAETAFLASAEYASCALLERVNLALSQVREIKEKTLEVERASNELHSLIIVESGRGLK